MGFWLLLSCIGLVLLTLGFAARAHADSTLDHPLNISQSISADGAPRSQRAPRSQMAKPDSTLEDPAALVTATLKLDADRQSEGRLVAKLFGLAAVPKLPVDAHIVFVMDASGSMAGQPTAEMKKGAKDMIRLLEMLDHPSTKVGIVQFNTVARTLCQLTNDPGRAGSCVNKIGASGGTAIDAGIRDGLKVLLKERASLPHKHQEIMVVLSDGLNNADCPPVLAAADVVKADNIRLFSICAGPGCDRVCMKQVATPGDDYEVLNFVNLPELFSEIGWQSRAVPGIEALELQLLLPDGVRIDKDSASIPPDTFAEGIAIWRVDRLDRDGVSVEVAMDVSGEPSGPVVLRVVAETSEGLMVAREEALGVPEEALPPTSRPLPTPTQTVTPVPWHRVYLPFLRQIEGLD
jgi:Mg-chelatase subunit ChlD